jgi:hypothetical protein
MIYLLDSIRVDPYVKEIQYFGNETLDFKCECKENVTITFSDEKKRDVIYHQDVNSLYPYVATYNAKVGEFSNNSLTWVNCTILNESEKYLHTWEIYPGGWKTIYIYFKDFYLIHSNNFG